MDRAAKDCIGRLPGEPEANWEGEFQRLLLSDCAYFAAGVEIVM